MTTTARAVEPITLAPHQEPRFFVTDSNGGFFSNLDIRQGDTVIVTVHGLNPVNQATIADGSGSVYSLRAGRMDLGNYTAIYATDPGAARATSSVAVTTNAGYRAVCILAVYTGVAHLGATNTNGASTWPPSGLLVTFPIVRANSVIILAGTGWHAGGNTAIPNTRILAATGTWYTPPNLYGTLLEYLASSTGDVELRATFGGTGGAQLVGLVLEPELPAPTIVYFEAEPETIDPGEHSILRWDTTNATSVTINGEEQTAVFGILGVHPVQTTTYTLVATSPSGVASESVTVTVREPEPPPVENDLKRRATGLFLFKVPIKIPLEK